jgi:hypothetical protein
MDTTPSKSSKASASLREASLEDFYHRVVHDSDLPLEASLWSLLSMTSQLLRIVDECQTQLLLQDPISPPYSVVEAFVNALKVAGLMTFPVSLVYPRLLETQAGDCQRSPQLFDIGALSAACPSQSLTAHPICCSEASFRSFSSAHVCPLSTVVCHA